MDDQVLVKFIIFEKEVVALFPNIKENEDYISSYAHVGQHSGASYSLMKCKKATKDEYKDLLNELKGQGYDNLLILNEKVNKNKKPIISKDVIRVIEGKM
jgi:hypothetical protein